MTVTKLDVRQSINRTKLDQLFNILPADGKEVDDILSDINDDLTPPLRLMGTIPATLVLNIESIFKTTTDTGKRRTIPPISNLLPNFTSGSVTFPASSGGTVTVSPGTNQTLTVSSGNYIKCGINLDANGNLNIMFGTEGSTEALATVPPTIDGTFAIGYVVLHNVAGVIQNFSNSQIIQYVGGGGGGSGGNASEDLESLKNTLMDSTYELLSYNIFKLDGSTKNDGASTGAYSLVTKTFDMTVGQTLVSQQLLDLNEFLGQGLDVSQIDLQVFWASGLVDTAATYEVSRDNGVNWQDMSAEMERIGSTRSYIGTHRFTEEPSFSSFQSNATETNSYDLNDSDHLKLAQKFTLAASSVLKTLDIKFTTSGSPVGYMWIAVVKDDGTGKPSEVLSDKLGESSAISIAALISGNTITVNLPNIVIPDTNNYWFVLRTDDQYKAASASNKVNIRYGTSSGMTWASYNSLVPIWNTNSNQAFVHNLKGRVLNLRVRITASATRSLDGFGVFYSNTTGNIVTGLKNIEVFKFKAVADNDNEFTLTRFIPDPDLLKCFYVEGGQAFVRPAFELQGSKIVFPVDTFNNGGVEADVTLIFQQLEGSSFDNNPENALLLSENHLGSQDNTLDKSVNGRGIFLRRPDGTLREICIDNLDNIVIYSI